MKTWTFQHWLTAIAYFGGAAAVGVPVAVSLVQSGLTGAGVATAVGLVVATGAAIRGFYQNPPKDGDLAGAIAAGEAAEKDSAPKAP